jgi:ribonuclease VapC
MQRVNEVLDASALLAWLQAEPGADTVVIEGARMNSVNWSEVLQKATQHGVEITGLQEELQALGLQLHAFSLAEAEEAASLYAVTKPQGLSLADRSCLATARVHDAVAVTADSNWSQVEGVRVRLIR